MGHIVWDILRWWTSKSSKYGNVYYRKTHAEEWHPPFHPHLGHQWTHKSCYNPAVNEINPSDNSDMWVLNHLPTGFTYVEVSFGMVDSAPILCLTWNLILHQANKYNCFYDTDHLDVCKAFIVYVFRLRCHSCSRTKSEYESPNHKCHETLKGHEMSYSWFMMVFHAAWHPVTGNHLLTIY